MAKFKVRDVVKRGKAIGFVACKNSNPVWEGIESWWVTGVGWLFKSGKCDADPCDTANLFPYKNHTNEPCKADELTHATRAEAISFAKKYPRAKVNIPKAPRRPLPTKATKRKAVKK